MKLQYKRNNMCNITGFVTSVACSNCKYGVSQRAFLRELFEKVGARAKKIEEEG